MKHTLRITKKKINQISTFSMLINLGLFTLKLLGGLASNSIALLSDATNHLSDSLSSLVYWLGQRLSLRAPDDNHPQGHGRGEYLTALVIALLMLFVAGQFFIESLRRIMNPSPLVIEPWVVAIILLAILLKFVMYLFLRSMHLRYQLMSMKALKTDNLFDVVISVIVLGSFLLQSWVTMPLDGYAGVLVALLMALNGGKMMLDGIREVLGKPLNRESKRRVQEILKQYPLVLGSHGYHFHDYGPTYQLLTFHAEVSDQLSLVAAHDLIDQIEEKLVEEMGIQVLIHLDPMVTQATMIAGFEMQISEALAHHHLQDEVLAVRPIQEKHHQEIVVIVRDSVLKQQIKTILINHYPMYRFCVEAKEIE